jgi:hypothetical protein
MLPNATIRLPALSGCCGVICLVTAPLAGSMRLTVTSYPRSHTASGSASTSPSALATQAVVDRADVKVAGEAREPVGRVDPDASVADRHDPR